jgi:hypothetical protein
MKCWNLTFNARGSRIIIIPSCTCKSSENVCSNNGGAQEKGKTRWKLSLPQKLVEKLVWVLVISLCKIFIPWYAFDGLLCWNKASCCINLELEP